MSENSKHNWKHILNIVGIVLASIYCIVAIAHFNSIQQKEGCKRLSIVINDIERYSFVNHNDIQKKIDNSGIKYIGEKITPELADTLEKVVRSINMVRKAEVYKSADGNIVVEVWQREPIMKVLSSYEGSFYIDSERQKMPISPHETTFLIKVTGHIKYSKAKGELFDFVQYILNDSFWCNHIKEIHFTEDGCVYLIARKGVKTIKLGNFKNYRNRLDNLYAWYEQYPTWAWKSNKYKMINISYDNLVFCKK